MRHIPPFAEEGAKLEPDRAKPELKLGETFSPN